MRRPYGRTLPVWPTGAPQAGQVRVDSLEPRRDNFMSFRRSGEDRTVKEDSP